MNNFFFDNSDYDLFKKALRSTKNEPVVISILSDDNSLREDGDNNSSSTTVRKQMSSKFQASPFDKFFGPRKKRTDPVDMKDFSSWKNKNYRESEKQINETPEETKKFSFSDYLSAKTREEKFNEEDKLKNESQKSIEQMSSSDENFAKFSLDSYLNKLEQESKAKKDFAESEDLIDLNTSDEVMSDLDNQDENFAVDSNVDIEDFTFGGDVGGDKFSIDKEELDSVKARLEKKAREENNIKDKPTTKVISTEEINELKGKTDEDDEFNLDKLGIEDDIERVNSKIESLNKILQVTGDGETESPKVEHKRFVEVNKNFDKSQNTNEINQDTETVAKEDTDEESSTEQSQNQNEIGVVEPVKIDGSINSDELDDDEDIDVEQLIDELEIPEDVDATNNLQKEDVESLKEGQETTATETNIDENYDMSPSDYGDASKYTTEINKNADYLTKADFKNFTEEIVNKFSEMYRDKPVSDGQNYEQPYVDAQQVTSYTQPYVAQPGVNQDLYAQQSELQAKIVELLEQNKKTDQDVAEKLQIAEMEKQRVAKEYEAKLHELETSIRQREEEVRKQAYIEKLKSDIKIKKSESRLKQREEQIRETEKISSEKQFAGEKLKSELKNNLNVSNLEMDKKLLECVNKFHKDVKIEIDDEPEEIEEVKRPTRTRNRTNKTTRRRSTVSSRMRTRVPRRKIDSDIIGGINFD